MCIERIKNTFKCFQIGRLLMLNSRLYSIRYRLGELITSFNDQYFLRNTLNDQ